MRAKSRKHQKCSPILWDAEVSDSFDLIIFGEFMSAPIAIQLYSVREDLGKDFAGTIRKIARMGYAGVETAGFPGTTALEAAKLFKELGLSVTSAHSPLPLGDKQNEVLDNMAALGCKYLVCASLPRETFTTVDQIKVNCDKLSEANAVAKRHGLTLFYHNHDWEFVAVGDKYGYQIFLECLDPTIKLELDTYWIKAAGYDPVEIKKQLGSRAPLLHIKDGPAVRGQPMTAVGDGVVDVRSIIAAGQSTAEWLIVEIDQCATDMLEAVEKSCAYLIGEGLAHGKS
jgi:sugar phosphate isomerase/epimerase